MIVLNAHQLQQLAERLQEIERRQEAGGGETHVIEEGLEEVAERVGVHLEMLRITAPETIVEVLAPGGGGDPGKLWVVAELLHRDWRLHRRLGETDAAEDRRRKALLLYERVQEDAALPEGAPEPEDRMAELEAPPE